MKLDPEKRYYTMTELRNINLSHYRVRQLVEQNKLLRLNRSTYENLGFLGDENDYHTAQAYVPFGVICLMSAARYHELTNFLPERVDIAIERKKKVTKLPQKPEIKLYYFSSERMTLGLEQVRDQVEPFSIFNMEKTVVDIISYRNQVGIEETAEILKKYLSKKNKNINLLYEYAQKLHAAQVLRRYLEVLLI